MALFSRTSVAAAAVHARVSDGEHLWLAVTGAELPLALVGGGSSLVLETRAEGELVTAVVPLAASWPGDPDGPDELRLVDGRKQAPVTAALTPRPAGPTLATPCTRDGRWQLSVEDVDGTVVVRRAPAPRGIAAVGFAVTDASVEVTLADGRRLRVSTDPGPVLVDGVPVVRARNVLDRPNFAVTLPPLTAPGVELRWSKDGRLTVVAP